VPAFGSDFKSALKGFGGRNAIPPMLHRIAGNFFPPPGKQVARRSAVKT
jgi:hypothetical protein